MTPLEAVAAYAASSDRSTREAGVKRMEEIVMEEET